MANPGLYLVSSPDPSPAPRRRLRVLVADDDRDTVLTITALLRDEGHDVRAVHDGRVALAAVREFAPDAAVLDISMPGMNGWDVAKEIRKQGAMVKPPMLIGISGIYKQAADRLLGELAGFNYYLSKPYDPKVLAALLARLSTRV